MWNYEKRLQYPVKITQTNPKLAQVIISQFGAHSVSYKVRNDIVEYIVNNWNDDFDNTGLLDFLRCIISPIQSRSIDLVRQEFIAAVRKVVPPYVLVCMKIFMNGVVFCDHKHLQEHIDKLFDVARKYPEFLPDFDEIKLFPAPSFMDRNPICYQYRHLPSLLNSSKSIIRIHNIIITN